MHTIYWRLKRVYLLNLHRVQRPLLKPIGLTPARFDLMFCLYRNGGSAWQSKLWKALRVCAVTVMRMVQSLEDLGFVTRERSRLDRRQMEITLTAEGLRRALAVMHELMDTGRVDSAVHRAFVSHAPKDKDVCFRVISWLDDRFLSVQRALFDTSRMGYAWHPDD